MSELEDFLSEVLPRQKAAEKAMHDGDAGPRIRIWSQKDPVTLLGAFGVARSGWAEVEETFHWVATRFSDCTDYELELIAAGVSGDIAYTVGYERATYSFEGGPVEQRMVRATHVYRREDGEWRIMHRHGDSLAAD